MEQDVDTGAIALFALRYCMGRMTYEPSLTIDWVQKHWHCFSDGAKQNIRRDVLEFVSSGRSLGMDCDEETWRSFEAWLSA
ncbi:hypothetical protein, partial [Chlorogloeopsis fritschii]